MRLRSQTSAKRRTRTRRTGRRSAGERGAREVLGLVLIAPAALGMALVIVFLSRGVDSRATAQSAAEAAAQAAAQERTPAAARAAGRAVADAMLIDDTTCPNPMVKVITDEFPLGQVRVMVSCSPSLSGLEALGDLVDDPEVYTATATLDPYRGGS